MQVTKNGRVTIPKHIRLAVGIVPGSEVSVALEGGKIVIAPAITLANVAVREDRRAKLRDAAARVRASFSSEFKHAGADEIMQFLRGEDAKTVPPATTAANLARDGSCDGRI